MASQEATKPVKYIREGFHTITPYLVVGNPSRFVDFLKQAFGAEELLRTTGSAGGMHAEIRMGDSILEMGEAHSQFQPMPCMIYLYMDNVDAVHKRALQAGASSIEEPADQPYGDRRAAVKDPFGNAWYIATHMKDVSL